MNPLQAGWNKDPVGFAGRALQHKGSSVAPHSLATSENAHFPLFVPCHLFSSAGICVPFPGLAERGEGGAGRVRGSGVASAVTLSHKGER